MIRKTNGSVRFLLRPHLFLKNAKNVKYLYCTQESMEKFPDWAKGLHNR